MLIGNDGAWSGNATPESGALQQHERGAVRLSRLQVKSLPRGPFTSTPTLSCCDTNPVIAPRHLRVLVPTRRPGHVSTTNTTSEKARDLEPVATRAVACLSLPAASHTPPLDDQLLPASLCCFSFDPLRSPSDSAYSSGYTPWRRGRHSIDRAEATRCFEPNATAFWPAHVLFDLARRLQQQMRRNS